MQYAVNAAMREGLAGATTHPCGLPGPAARKAKDQQVQRSRPVDFIGIVAIQNVSGFLKDSLRPVVAELVGARPCARGHLVTTAGAGWHRYRRSFFLFRSGASNAAQ